MKVEKRNGTRETLDVKKIHRAVDWSCNGLDVSLSDIETGAHIQFFDGIKTDQIHKALIASAASLIDVDAPDYEYAASRLLLLQVYKEVGAGNGSVSYSPLIDYINRGISVGRLDPELLGFDFDELERAIVPDRDMKFKYLGMQNIYDRYLVQDTPKKGEVRGAVIEMPQHFWMRVAMGLALAEAPHERTFRAIQFYDVLSKFEFVSSTPTLFNSGTTHPQLASCFLNTVEDAIWEESDSQPIGDGIFATITECALLSKFAGGIGTDWTPVRSTGSLIRSTNGVSSGIVPYLKVFNDTAVAVNQGGKRNGSFSAYLEPWHGDIERFIVLKKPSGEERLRAREIFPAVWTNDLFMERVRDDKQWSLFCPHNNSDLHGLYGDAFKVAYEKAEAAGDAIKVVSASALWKKIITALVESGAPWITFKDEANRRNPQDHVGVINSSNLCTEIMENSSKEETAVCNLGSVNLSVIGTHDFSRVIPIAMRMLDNVIDLNFYPTDKARVSSKRHRPVGLGVMGWTEHLVKNGIDWESIEHLQESDNVFEAYSYWAIRGSMLLAKERGTYQSYKGSKWDRGIFPIDTARELPKEWSALSPTITDWTALRQAVKKNGMRNSNCTAIAPTATIANIVGTEACIEPIFKQVFVKENLSGKFKVVAPALRHGKPELCKVAFNIDQTWLIKAAAVRQKWLCQSQSVNLFKKIGVKGNEISSWYFLAWELGLKSTYYLKQQVKELTREESGTETTDTSGLVAWVGENVAPDVLKDAAVSDELVHDAQADLDEMVNGVKACSIENPECESCQ